jgi:hypothetical protein
LHGVAERRYKSRDVAECRDESQQVANVAHTEAEAEAKKSKRARKVRTSRVPEDFSPDLDLARSLLPDVDAEREAQKFRDWEFKTPRSDWAAVWRTWIENCRDTGRYAKKPKGGGGAMMINGKPVEWQ